MSRLTMFSVVVRLLDLPGIRVLFRALVRLAIGKAGWL